ncbi:FAD-dependent oxidoreductase [Rhodoblastus sp.]|jgi:glycine oxidase|uniref:FAD-dependent oxidoreductase n=1 Tax=Rhodoblastus sp. TaxID=1962975 RepID=UPI00262753CD|nr:FAD-dependent oxidoreductase [Rhodoblastus sp.]
MRIRIVGAGVAGLTVAYEFASRGAEVELVEREEGPGRGCSWYAGGMVAPWCELESAEPLVCQLGIEALDFWTRRIPVAQTRGSLVVATPRDMTELRLFARRAQEFEEIGGNRIAELEPDLAGRFSRALFFPKEAHLDPRVALETTTRRLAAMSNVRLRFGIDAEAAEGEADWTIDCTGYAAKSKLPGLRGVKGEMMILAAPDLNLSRPIRLLHPRHPVYVVPREENRFMIGATQIENEERARVTARSIVDLINSAYAVHPAFAEAEVAETGSDLRPAFSDNLPRLIVRGRTIFINGLFRHGFLLAPSLARRAADYVYRGLMAPEVMRPAEPTLKLEHPAA